MLTVELPGPCFFACSEAMGGWTEADHVRCLILSRACWLFVSSFGSEGVARYLFWVGVSMLALERSSWER